jgi:hypothetical protein
MKKIKKKATKAATMKAKRPPLPPAIELEVVLRTKRRCPLCFGLHGDTRISQGQIAHLDRDHANHALTNLMFMCLPHHDSYDSRTSQSKGLLRAEAEAYQSELIAYLTANDAPSWVEAGDNRSLVRPKAPTAGVSLALHQVRLPIYHAVREFLDTVTATAQVEISDLRSLADKTGEALFLYGAPTADFILETYREGVRLRLAGQRLEHARKAHQPLTDKMIDEEYNLLNWFTGRIEAWRRHVHPFLLVRNDAH